MSTPSDRSVLSAEQPGALVRYKPTRRGVYGLCFAVGIALGIWLAHH